MISNRSGKRLATTVLVLVVAIAMLTLAAGTTASAPARGTTALALSPASHHHHHTIVVYPNGVNDTADIQAAFNACVSYGPGCTVELVKGTYYTAQIEVTGFQGGFVGAGEGRTIIQALPNLPSPTTTPFWAALPSATNPWPVLFTFINGTFQISGFTLNESFAAPTAGWFFPLYDETFTSLFAGIEVTGSQALATIDHLSITGASGDINGFNVLYAVLFGGFLVPLGGSDAYGSGIPLSGQLQVTSSTFSSETTAVWILNIVNVQANVCGNVDTNSAQPFTVIDSSNSQILICGNRATDVGIDTGVAVVQSVFRSGLLPSSVYVLGNDFQVGDGAGGVTLVDYGVASTLSGVILGNRIVTDTSCGCYVGSDPADYSVIATEYLVSSVISANTIFNGGSAGVYVAGGPATVNGNIVLGAYAGAWVDYANDVNVTGNLIVNSATWGIAVTDGSSNNLIAYNVVTNSGLYDLYWDGTGTGNVWTNNTCSTSSPSGLC